MSRWLARFNRDERAEIVFVISYRQFVKNIRDRMKVRGVERMTRQMLEYGYGEWTRLARKDKGDRLRPVVQSDDFYDEMIDDQSSVCLSVL